MGAKECLYEMDPTFQCLLKRQSGVDQKALERSSLTNECSKKHEGDKRVFFRKREKIRTSYRYRIERKKTSRGERGQALRCTLTSHASSIIQQLSCFF
jgi:hypothetical protein